VALTVGRELFPISASTLASDARNDTGLFPFPVWRDEKPKRAMMRVMSMPIMNNICANCITRSKVLDLMTIGDALTYPPGIALIYPPGNALAYPPDIGLDI
jgi:hypothetical protein